MKCKLNDLCFVVKAQCNANLGKVVKIVDNLGYFNKDSELIYDGDAWDVPVSESYVVVKGNLVDQLDRKCKYGVLPKSWLTPIKGEPLEDTESFIKELNLELVE